MKHSFTLSLLASLVMMLISCGNNGNTPLTFETYEKEGLTETTEGAPIGIRVSIAVPQEDNAQAQAVTNAICEIMTQSQLGQETGAPKEGTLQEIVDDYVQRFLQKPWGEEYGPMQCDLLISNGFQNASCIVLHVADGLYGNGGPVEFDAVVRLSDGHIMQQDEMVSISADELYGIIQKALGEGDETPIMLEEGYFISPVAADSCKILWPTGSHFTAEVIVPLSVMEPFLTEEGRALFTGTAPAAQSPASEAAEEKKEDTPAEAVTPEFILDNGKLGPIEVGMKRNNLPASVPGLYDKAEYKKETKADMDGEWTEEYMLFYKDGKEIIRSYIEDNVIQTICLQEGSSFIKTSDGFYVGYPARDLFQQKKMEWGNYFMGEVFASSGHYTYYVNSDYLTNTDIPTKASDFQPAATLTRIEYRK